MPEWGMIPMPKALLKQGHRDMVRLSDARMSGTSYGACILHVAPEAYVGGPLALIETGDMIEVDVPNRILNVDISDAEMAARREKWVAPPLRYERGWGQMYTQHIEQADKDAISISFARIWSPRTRARDQLMALGRALCVSGILVTPDENGAIDRRDWSPSLIAPLLQVLIS